MTKRLQTLKDVESRGGGCGVLGRRKVALEKVRSSRVRKNVWSPWQLRHLDHSMRSRWTTTWPGTLIMEVWWVEKDLHAKEWRQERSKSHHCQDFHRVVRSKWILSDENGIIQIILDPKLVQASVRDGWVRIFYAQKMLIRILQTVTGLSGIRFPAGVLYSTPQSDCFGDTTQPLSSSPAGNAECPTATRVRTRSY